MTNTFYGCFYMYFVIIPAVLASIPLNKLELRHLCIMATASKYHKTTIRSLYLQNRKLLPTGPDANEVHLDIHFNFYL